MAFKLTLLPRRCMHKVSTPGDREEIACQIPELMTKLEMAMPIGWNSTVIHIFTFHTLEIMTRAGPYHAANILDIERYHTKFKTFARAKKHVMTSINNHFLLHEAAQTARMDADMIWTDCPAHSTFAGHAARLDSEDKSDRVCTPKGQATAGHLNDEEFQQVQTLWADNYEVYHALHQKFNRFCRNARGAARPANISEWNPMYSPLSEKETKWQKMVPITKVCEHTHTCCVLYLPLEKYCCLVLIMYRYGRVLSCTPCRFGRTTREFNLEEVCSDRVNRKAKPMQTTHTYDSTTCLPKPGIEAELKKVSHKSNECLCTSHTQGGPREWW